MPAHTDIVGERYGKLVVLDQHWDRYKRCTMVRVKCDCGVEKEMRKSNLVYNGVQSCGCEGRKNTSSSKLIDLTGKRFGMLVVTGRAPNRGNRTMWHVQCDCGCTSEVDGSCLRDGRTKSCGCTIGRPGGAANLVGKVFGKLTVTSFAYSDGRRNYWNCDCSCGGHTVVQTALLTTGGVKSCGCLITDVLNERNTTHGMAHTRLYSIWCNMKSRCGNPDIDTYDRYGAMGIEVCNTWQEFEPFAIWAISHGYGDSLTLDRINPYLGYSEFNCRWTTLDVQAINKRDTYVKAFYEVYSERICSIEFDALRDKVDALCRILFTEHALFVLFQSITFDIASNSGWTDFCNFLRVYIQAAITLMCCFVVCDDSVVFAENWSRRDREILYHDMCTECERLSVEFTTHSWPVPQITWDVYNALSITGEVQVG